VLPTFFIFRNCESFELAGVFDRYLQETLALDLQQMYRMVKMIAAFMACICLVGTPADSPCTAPYGYLYQPAFAIDETRRLPAEPYAPQPGDIFMATDNDWLQIVGHRAAWSGPPHHSGLVIARQDGRFAILEAGPHNGFKVEWIDVIDHLRSYESKNELVWIRRRSVPLTAEQSSCLTEWAARQDGKDFAYIRIAGQVTFFLRSRGPLRTWFVGGPHGERDTYFCSELATESCVHAGLLEAAKTRPAATYPRDLFFGDSLNPFLHLNLAINSAWEPPARWTEHP
jgi:hypothetical protein